ncbi:MAG: DUF2946 family protein, partial [Candidatus Sericytochromatia bacterium]
MNNLIVHDFGKLKIDQNGTWFHNDEKFNHQGIAELFSRSIVKDSDDNYYLQLGSSKVSFEYEISPYIIVDIDFHDNELDFISNIDEVISINKVEKIFLTKDSRILIQYKSKIYILSKRTYNFILKYIDEDDNGYFI